MWTGGRGQELQLWDFPAGTNRPLLSGDPLTLSLPSYLPSGFPQTFVPLSPGFLLPHLGVFTVCPCLGVTSICSRAWGLRRGIDSTYVPDPRPTCPRSPARPSLHPLSFSDRAKHRTGRGAESFLRRPAHPQDPGRWRRAGPSGSGLETDRTGPGRGGALAGALRVGGGRARAGTSEGRGQGGAWAGAGLGAGLQRRAEPGDISVP